MKIMLDTIEAADYLGLAAVTLETWRYKKSGPAYIKSGGRIFYLKKDLDDWIQSRRIDPENQ